MVLTLSLILALWQNWRNALELTSISPRVAEDRCAMTLGFRLQPPLLKVVNAEPACAHAPSASPMGIVGKTGHMPCYPIVYSIEGALCCISSLSHQSSTLYNYLLVMCSQLQTICHM